MLRFPQGRGLGRNFIVEFSTSRHGLAEVDLIRLAFFSDHLAKDGPRILRIRIPVGCVEI
jgi:hypothetical protein